MNSTPRLRSGLYFPRMEHLTINLGDNTELHISYEYDPGSLGSYNEPPSIDLISIENVELSQLNGKEYHTVKLYGIDDTLFPVDYQLLEQEILEKIQL